MMALKTEFMGRAMGRCAASWAAPPVLRAGFALFEFVAEYSRHPEQDQLRDHAEKIAAAKPKWAPSPAIRDDQETRSPGFKLPHRGWVKSLKPPAFADRRPPHSEVFFPFPEFFEPYRCFGTK
jgi:hypothetical protein